MTGFLFLTAITAAPGAAGAADLLTRVAGQAMTPRPSAH
jgi:hypothetical protein